MATWTYDIATEIGQVRRLIGDTDIVPTTDATFNDEEIQFFLNLGGSVLAGAAKALEAWASALTSGGDLSSEKIGDYAYTKKTSENLMKLADKYRKQDMETPYFTFVEMDLNAIGEPDD